MIFALELSSNGVIIPQFISFEYFKSWLGLLITEFSMACRKISVVGAPRWLRFMFAASRQPPKVN